MCEFAIELGLDRSIRNSSQCFNGTDHGAEGDIGLGVGCGLP